ncbi:Relaxase/Mobilisation nuclease domain-containing protein [Chitinophaga eiseniae]|uniref:Relaxase/Mobilisation nuclease domain-containing protein n=1 Tax=Chitinophaga eiseniae TaxID=634771 RepID=A0A1T4SXT9_9BACT|nr:conjugal transfer protein MobB [Chitinophaga eiseniae]SKA33033.1 Relaxase/Mobilisation nuclease domain-containing protein [Chitinophaga eiseniae]
MIAKIAHGENITGALEYNQRKVEQENGTVLFTSKMVESLDGSFSVAQLRRSFAPYLLANRKTEKPVIHISLNPDPRDKVSDEAFIEMAQKYMQHMGYGEQPFVVFKHTDINRAHCHIVTVCVDEHGKKIPDTFERRRSMEICRSLEQQYGLQPATGQHQQTDDRLFRSVDHQKGDIKSQIAAVVRYLPERYHFQGLGAYNALLSLYNITAEEVKGELAGKVKSGLVYIALDGEGNKVSNPFKASLFGKKAGHANMEVHYTRSKADMKESDVRSETKRTIEVALHSTKAEATFKQQLKDQGIDTVIRRSAEGRIYGITFVDHTHGMVWNGSQLGKELSANTFNTLWLDTSLQQPSGKDELLPGGQPPEPVRPIESPDPFGFFQEEVPAGIIDFEQLIEGLGGWLPEAGAESMEELQFSRNMKKKKRRRQKPEM